MNFCLFSGGVLFCLPWCWLTFRCYCHGGFCIEIEEPPTASYVPKQFAYVEFLPHQIRGMYWRIPNTPEKWKWEFIWAWDELMERLIHG